MKKKKVMFVIIHKNIIIKKRIIRYNNLDTIMLLDTNIQ